MARKTQKLILVTGATGHQGGAVLRHLREKGFAVRALTRDPNHPKARALAGHGTEVVTGNWNDPESLVRAMDGVDGVYSVQNREEGVESEIRYGIQVADAAKRSRVSHLVYSSVAGADHRTGVPHFESKFRIEEHIRGTGVPYTIFRPPFFMENWLALRDRIEQGSLAFPVDAATRLPMIAVDDIGAFVTMAFERPGKWVGRALDIAGDELSMAELAGTFSRITGHAVAYQQISFDEFAKQTNEDIAKMWRFFQDPKGFRIDVGAVRLEYPQLMSFERWLHAKWPTAAGQKVA